MLPFSRVSRWTATVLAAAGLGGCQVKHSLGKEDVPPQLTFDDLRYRVYRGPLLTAEGTAAHASMRRDTSVLAAEQVTVRFPPAGDNAEARITAARGAGNLRQRDFWATGGVRFEQADQVALTDEARYDAASGLVHGEKPIEVHGGSSLTVRGPAFTLDPRQQRLGIQGGAAITAGEARP
jgi:hypothetical protein